MGAPKKSGAAAWRPSKVNEERLSSLSPARTRAGFRVPRGVRPALTAVLFVCFLYIFWKLWFKPEAGQLRPALAIFIGALILLIVAGATGAFLHRHRKGSDDKSTLRL